MTVTVRSQFPDSLRHGVLVLRGYGLRIAVERGHLVLEDGLAEERRAMRLSRIRRDLRRLVVIGHSGTVSFEALRWLHDVGAAFVQIDSDGQLVVAGGPNGPHLPALRRAQALASQSDAGLRVTRDLLCAKLEGQAHVLERLVSGPLMRPRFQAMLYGLETVGTPTALRDIEAQAAALYWIAWQSIPVRFARGESDRVPEHWRIFGARTSVLTASPRRAINPGNALLNYLYAILEAEARISILAMGADPALGILHADLRNRDSLACDVMEAARPAVDGFLLDLLGRRMFRRDEFFEMADGGCRLLPPMAEVLAATMPRWAQLLGPIVEGVAERLIEHATSRRGHELPTPLTERNRRAGRRRVRQKQASSLAAPAGLEVPSRAESWDLQPSAPEALGIRSGHGALTRTVFLRSVVPLLRKIPAEDLARATGLSVSYCARIRAGGCVPHPRHWTGVQAILKQPPDVT